MHKILTIIIFCFLLITNLNAEIVSKISIIGNKRVSLETIKVYGDIEIGKDYSETDINKTLNKLYETEFFENVEISLKNNILTINLKEYPIVNQLVITGEKSKKFKNQIKKIIKLKSKNSYIKSYLTDDISTIKNLYSSIGYSFAEVSVKVKEIDKDKFDLLLEINRGEKS